jgi:2-hydroxycyclohexanecarboxyl-CoA dehydrogenase
MSRAAVITGAGGAIGGAIALILAKRGWQTIGVDLRFNGETPHLHRRVEQDICDSIGFRAVLTELAGAAPVEALVNCAGISRVGRFLDADDAEWRRLLEVNFMAALTACHTLLPAMIGRGKGSIVNIISDSARVGASGEAVYSAAKGALAAFTRSIAQEVGSKGVRVNCVSPGPVETPMSAGNPELMEKLAKRIPLKRVAKPADVASAVAFLIGDEASYITGQTSSVSGGLTMAG